MKNPIKNLTVFLSGIVFSLTLGIPTYAQDQIGVAAAVNQNTTDLTLEEERRLVEAGYKIIQNHTIETDNVGKAQMLLLDGTAFTVGPNSSVTLDRFIYNPQTAEGSLEVTSRGLMRLVGGKVTKEKPALIRTNAATIGIRGGITIIQSENESTTAAFVYGDEMRVTPTQNADGDIVLTEQGFVVVVENPSDEIDFPDLLTVDILNQFQEGLEGSEEEEEGSETTEEESEEESEEEGSEEEESEASSDDEAENEEEEETEINEESEEESSEEEASPEQDSSSDETGTDEAPADQETDVETDTDIDVDPDIDSSPDVNEDALDTMGISDISSDADPDTLSVADDFDIDIDLEVDTADDAREEISEETNEAAQTSVEDDAAKANAAEITVFEVQFDQLVDTTEENKAGMTVGAISLDNPSNIAYTVTIEGEGGEQFSYNQDSGELTFTGNADYENLNRYDLVVVLSNQNGGVRNIPFSIVVDDINEPPEVTNTLMAETFAETLAVGTTIATSVSVDPENATITYSLSGSDSEKFTIDSNGNIKVASTLDYETKDTYNLMVTTSDGSYTQTREVVVSITDVNEAPTLSSTIAASSFSESTTVGTTIANYSSSDPEASGITYSLSGADSGKFAIASDGTVTLTSALDYEIKSGYSIIVNASDGTHTTSHGLTISATNVNEAPTLSSTLAASSFAESSAVGTTIATSSASDSEASTINWSLSGTDSGKFAIASDGTVTIGSLLDFETKQAYSVTVNASDGTYTTSQALTVITTNVNEAPSLSTTLAASSFAESTAVRTIIATFSTSDPESSSITYSLSGTDSGKFSIASDGTLTLSSSLDYEVKQTYSVTVNVFDGTHTASQGLSISATNVNEAPSL